VLIDATAITDLAGNAFAGITDPNTWSFSTPGATIVDSTPPTLQPNVVTTVAGNAPFEVKVVVVENESTVSNVSVDYRMLSDGPGAFSNQALSLVAGSGNVYSFSFPSNQLGPLGLEYRIKATSVGGTKTDITRNVRISQADGLTIPYSSHGTEQANYRIVSVPLELETNTMRAVFTDDLGAIDIKKWRVGRYENGTNNQNYDGSIVPGQGYWLLVRTSGPTIDTGPGVTVAANLTDQFKISLTQGWNQIGNPFTFPLSWADVQAANPGLPGISVYTGGYAPGTTLAAFEGAFINMAAAQTITIPLKRTVTSGRANGTPVLTNPIDQTDWEVSFKLQQGNLFTLMPGVGMRKRALNDFDAFDYFAPPRLDEFVEFNHTRKFNGTNYSRDIVPTEPNHIWEFTAETSRESDPVTIEWDNSYFGNNEQHLILWDEARQLGIDLREVTSYTFNPRESRRFKVLYGDRSFVNEKTKVSSLVLHDVYPNPAQTDATVAFSLPDRLQTAVEVYDMLGNKSVIFSGELPQGLNKVTWKPGDARTAGMYIIRVISGGEVKLKRLMVN
ncbi:MAG TPA: T9SS type A sorting domain-containing protein, partial [Cyclobacteriaceae bacterium]|nr:T9SS type A sorting domain-containing protein [Cyclobacteriaceae bacterium]